MRPRKLAPAYTLHKRTGRAQVNWTQPDGTRKNHLLPGAFGSIESRQAYDAICAEIRIANAVFDHDQTEVRQPTKIGLTVADLIQVFCTKKLIEFSNSTEHRDYLLSIRPLAHHFGKSIAASFTAKNLAATRTSMIKGYEHPDHGPQKPLCRRVVNQRIKRIQRMFKWATSEDLLHVEAYQRIATLEPLRRNRCEAIDHEPVKPVDPLAVERTLPYMPPVVADMIRVQRLTGLRSDNIVNMHLADLDASGPIWIYTPAKHKTMHHGHRLQVPIGPLAQAILQPYVARATTHVFTHRRNGPYTSATYWKLVNAAIERANRTEQPPIPHWHPHQLRHLRATEIAAQYGYETSRILIGHSTMQAHMIYAERDLKRATEVAQEAG